MREEPLKPYGEDTENTENMERCVYTMEKHPDAGVRFYWKPKLYRWRLTMFNQTPVMISFCR